MNTLYTVYISFLLNLVGYTACFYNTFTNKGNVGNIGWMTNSDGWIDRWTDRWMDG